MKNYFYQNALRNYTAILIDLFNDMKIVDSNDTVTKEKFIPCTFTPKEKLFYVINEDANDNKLDSSLPRLALFVESIDIALDRSLNTYAKRRFILSHISKHFDYMPIPYNFTFGLSSFTKSTDHMAQIMENILPYFNPSLTVRVKENSELPTMVRELPITLNSYTPNVSNEFTESERRIFQSDFSFLLEGWIYRPLDSDGKIVYDFTGNILNSTFVETVSG